MRSETSRKWIFITSVAILLAGGAVALTFLTPRPDPVRAADALRADGRYTEALDRYQAVLASDPNNEAALWGVAATHLARRDADMAIEYLNRYLQKHPRGGHAQDARQALARARGTYVDSQTASPELTPGPPPSMPTGPPRALVSAWERALKLEGRGQLLDAIAAYASIADSAVDGRVRAAALERMARCEARRPPIDYDRVRHFYLRAQRAYRDINDSGNANRCQELAHLAQEYARVKVERERLAQEKREIEKLAEEAVPQPEPGPREDFERALAAYHAGDYRTAVQVARELSAKDVVPAWYILGMIHARQGDWDAARRELRYYAAQEPGTQFADEARRELAAMEGKQPLLLDDFARPAVEWRIVGADPDTVPVTEPLFGPDPSNGPCLRVDPGQKVYASFDEAEVATIELRLYVRPSDAAPIPRTRFQPYGPKAVTCAPLLLGEKGYQFAGHVGKSVPRTAGWHRLVIDVSKALVSAQVDAEFIGQVRREADFIGIKIETDETEDAGPLYIDDVRVVEHIQAGETSE